MLSIQSFTAMLSSCFQPGSTSSSAKTVLATTSCSADTGTKTNAHEYHYSTSTSTSASASTLLVPAEETGRKATSRVPVPLRPPALLLVSELAQVPKAEE